MKHIVGESNRIHHKDTLDKLNSLEKIEVGTEVEAMAINGFKIKLIAVEVEEHKAVWQID